ATLAPLDPPIMVGRPALTDRRRGRDIFRNRLSPEVLSESLSPSGPRDLLMKLYVGNLPFAATQSDVQALFAQHGEVRDVALINDRDTGRPRGFGFVEMPNAAEANAAMSALNGQDYNGRALNINEAREREGGGGGGGRGGPRGGSRGGFGR